MDSCKGEKLSVYQPSFMIDSLLTRKGVDQNGGDFSSVSLDPVLSRGRENGGTINNNGHAALDENKSCISGTNNHSSENRSSCTKRESTSTSGGEEDEDGFRKRKKPRTAFSREQVADLEKKFQEKKYLSSAERGELAEKLKLSDMQVKTWFQNRRMKFKRQTEEAELDMKSPKYPTYPSFVPYGGFYSGYMPMTYKSDVVHYPYPTLRSPPTPSGSNFSPMSLTSPTHFSSLHSPLSRPSVHSPRTPSTSYFPNATPPSTCGVLTPLTPSSSSSPSPYHHHHTHHPTHPSLHISSPHHAAYFAAECVPSTSPNLPPPPSSSSQPAAAPPPPTVAAAVAGTHHSTPPIQQHVQQLQFTATAEWPRPLP